MNLATIFVRSVRQRASPRSVALIAGLAGSLALILWFALSREGLDCPGLEGADSVQADSPIEPYPYHPIVVPRWTPDGAIVFSRTGNMYVIQPDGSGMERLHGCATSPSTSPDASRIAYVGVYKTGLRGIPENLEIEISKLDGSDRRRLTFNTGSPGGDEETDTAPTWLPDGSGIVFVRHAGWVRSGQYGIYTVDSDGSDERAILHIDSPEWPNEYPDGERLYDRKFNRTRPALSPDGKMVAFVVEELADLPPDHPDRGPRVDTARYHTLYVAALDGSGLTRLFSGRTVPGYSLIPVAPTWNPRIPGQLLFLVTEYPKTPAGSILYSISTDDSEPRVVANLPTYSDYLEWSPDGTRSLVSHSNDPRHGLIYIVDPYSGRWSMVSTGGSPSWSPDGARIAKFSTDPPAAERNERYVTMLSTMAPDGTDVRVLARTDEDDRSSWSPVKDGSLTLADRIAKCKTGDIVPQPQDNPLLVEDCETLLTIRNAFADEPDSLNWDADTPISEWEGVTLSGSRPPRVEEIHLRGVEFIGVFRPEFGRLTGLKSLILGGRLAGPIPQELDALPNLEHLYVRGMSSIIGCIPPGLRGKINGYTEPEHCNQ